MSVYPDATTALIKSRRRMADFGEVFSPAWLVNAMLDQIRHVHRIETRFLEPACGSGNFLTAVLSRKFELIEQHVATNGFNRVILAINAVAGLYGIELLEDNVTECRRRLLNLFLTFLQIDESEVPAQIATKVLDGNIVDGDALKMCTIHSEPITFATWHHLGHGQFLRREFLFDDETSKFKAALEPSTGYPIEAESIDNFGHKTPN